MRTLKVCIALGLVAAVAVPAGAVVIPDPGPNGIKGLYSRDWDMGTTYTYDGTSGFPFTIDPDLLPSGGATRVKPTGARAQPGNPMELEDTWGLWLLYGITDGTVSGDGHSIIPSGNIYYENSNGGQATWLVGVFWGGDDTSITFTSGVSPGVLDVTIQASNIHMELWAVTKTDLGAGASTYTGLPYNAASRTADNRYTGWVDGVNGVQLLSGVSTFYEFNGKLYSNGTFSGTTEVWFDILENDPAGLWNVPWGTDPALLDPLNQAADAYMNWTLTVGSGAANDWDTYSRDFGGVNQVPEPMTMLGLACGIAGIAGYIRRRRA